MSPGKTLNDSRIDVVCEYYPRELTQNYMKYGFIKQNCRGWQSAISREKQLKGWRREKKIALIEKFNPRWQDLAEHWGREMRFRGQPLERTP